ncbi:hypothetical protein PQX77_015787 [Marasmius sp. AFHP31]|nr:hypothetical protein PQX77_015787 [Marasmius sp. AFHP31]
MPFTKGVSEKLDILVVGAGFAGLYQLQLYRKLRYNFRVFKAGSDIGGTWYWNRYPGARVDSPVPIYEFSNESLWKDWNWKEKYPGGEELRAYFRHANDKLDLRKDIAFNTRVVGAEWKEDEGHWEVKTDNGLVIHPRFLVLATSALLVPYTPAFKGLEKIEGIKHHTARWPEEGVDMKGKRVAVIGTGTSGVQVIQEVGSEVKSLAVFQRTPDFCLPMRQSKLDAETQMANKKSGLYGVIYCRRPQTIVATLAASPTSTYPHVFTTSRIRAPSPDTSKSESETGDNSFTSVTETQPILGPFTFEDPNVSQTPEPERTNPLNPVVTKGFITDRLRTPTPPLSNCFRSPTPPNRFRTPIPTLPNEEIEQEDKMSVTNDGVNPQNIADINARAYDKEIRIKPPAEFEGEQTKTTEFLSDIELYLGINEGIYNTDKKKMIFLLSNMKGGTAGDWKLLRVQEYNRVGWLTWDDFKKAFETAFSAADEPGQAQSKLRTIRQTEDVDNYIAKFQILASKSGISEDTALIEYFMEGLNPKIVEKIHD